MGRVGVLLLNLGGPEKLEDVRPFLFNLFSDPEIIRLPVTWLQKPLAWLISSSRYKKSQDNYKQIGGGSPLRRITEEQAQALEASLADKGQEAKIYVGMRYWHPFTEDAIAEIKKDKIDHLVILPLYPQFSISTSGSSFRVLERLWEEDRVLGNNVKYSLISSWYDRPGYLQAMADLIAQQLDQFEHPDQVHLFFSAHGVPVSYVEEAGITQVDLVKMDIEGAEIGALRGMRQTISHSPNLKLIMEYNPQALRSFGHDPAAAIAEVRAMGFTSLQLIEADGSLTDLGDNTHKLDELTQRLNQNMGVVNLLLTR